MGGEIYKGRNCVSFCVFSLFSWTQRKPIHIECVPIYVLGQSRRRRDGGMEGRQRPQQHISHYSISIDIMPECSESQSSS